MAALVKGSDSNFAEERRKGLVRWLKILSIHPIISNDPSFEVSKKSKVGCIQCQFGCGILKMVGPKK